MIIQKPFDGRNFFEIGKLLGNIYKNNDFNISNIKIQAQLYKNQFQVYKRYYPELIDELERIFEATKLEFDRLIYHFITDEILYYEKLLNNYITNKTKTKPDKACTIFGYYNDTNLFIGRNYDWLSQAEEVSQIYAVNNFNSYKYIAISDMGVISPKKIHPKHQMYQVNDAINEKGLFIGITFAYANSISNGLQPMHIAKLIAEKCDRVDDAINIFKNVPVAIPKNFFIADKYGHMVVVEHLSSYKFKLIYPKYNFLIKTNHYLDNEFMNEDIILDLVPSHTSFLRYFELLRKIKSKKKFSFNHIPKILRDPNSYLFQNTKKVKTIWTLALDITSSKYEVYYQKKGKNKSYRISV